MCLCLVLELLSKSYFGIVKLCEWIQFKFLSGHCMAQTYLLLSFMLLILACKCFNMIFICYILKRYIFFYVNCKLCFYTFFYNFIMNCFNLIFRVVCIHWPILTSTNILPSDRTFAYTPLFYVFPMSFLLVYPHFLFLLVFFTCLSCCM